MYQNIIILSVILNFGAAQQNIFQVPSPQFPTLPPPAVPSFQMFPTFSPPTVPRLSGLHSPPSLSQIYSPPLPTIPPTIPLSTLPAVQQLPNQPPITDHIPQIQHQLSRVPPIQIHRLYSSLPQQQINNDVYRFYPYHDARYYFNDQTQSHQLIQPHRLPSPAHLPQAGTPSSPSHPLTLFRPIYHGLRNERNHELATHHYGDHPRVIHTTRTQINNLQPQQPHPDHPPLPSPQPMHYPYHHPTGHHSAVHVNPTNVAYHVDGNNHGVGVPGLATFWYMCDTHNCQG